MKKFKAKLVARGPNGAWTFLEIPFNVEEVFGSKARVSVSGTMNGFAFQNSLLPQGDGTHAMAVSKAMQAGAGAQAGDTVTMTMDIDRSERVVTVPDELVAQLHALPKSKAAFDALSYSHRKELADWVAGAKQVQTRQRRAEKAAAMALEKKHLS